MRACMSPCGGTYACHVTDVWHTPLVIKSPLSQIHKPEYLFIHDYSLHFFNVELCFYLVYARDMAHLGVYDRHEERSFNMTPSLSLK